MKSLPAHAIRSLIIARKKLIGQCITLEIQIRGVAVVFRGPIASGAQPCLHRATMQAPPQKLLIC